jgi:hypothetical protein
LEGAEQTDDKEKSGYRQAETMGIALKYEGLPIPPFEKLVHLV